jgi:hypothetical protein
LTSPASAISPQTISSIIDARLNATDSEAISRIEPTRLSALNSR